jgi:hypothetical protein
MGIFLHFVTSEHTDMLILTCSYVHRMFGKDISMQRYLNLITVVAEDCLRPSAVQWVVNLALT